MHPENPETRKRFGLRQGFDVCTSASYLGGFIGGDDSKHDWPQDQKTTWEKNIYTISKTAGNNPNKVTPWWSERSYRSGYFCNAWPKTQYIHLQEWRIFLRKPFCLASSLEKLKFPPPIVGTWSTTPVNKSGLGLQNLVTPADEKVDENIIMWLKFAKLVGSSGKFHSKQACVINMWVSGYFQTVKSTQSIDRKVSIPPEQY